MKKVVSLMVSVLMLINPIVGVLAEEEQTETSAAVEEQVQMSVAVEVLAPDAAGNTEVTKTADKIDASGEGDQYGAIVNGDAATAALTVENGINAASSDGTAVGASVSSSSEQGSASLVSGSVAATSEGADADGLVVSTAGKESETAVKAADISATSTEGNASAVTAGASGDQNNTQVTSGNLSSEGKSSAAGIMAHSDSGSNLDPDEVVGSENKVTVTAGNVTASAENSTTAVAAETSGEKNAIEVNTGDISSEGNTSATGIRTNTNVREPWASEEDFGVENTITIKAGNVDSNSADGSATGVAVNASGEKTVTEVSTGDIASVGTNAATGIVVKENNYDRELYGENIVSSENKVIVNAGNINATSSDGSARAVDAEITGDNNTAEISTGDISAAGKDIAYGISEDVSGKGNTLDITSKNISLKASDTDGNSNSVGTTGVRAESKDGGKQTVKTGDIEVTSLSKTEFDEQEPYEESIAAARGVFSTATGKESEVQITTGSITAEATADGGIASGSGYNTIYTIAAGSAVDLTAKESGNISYTADGDVVLSLIANMEKREVEEKPSTSSTSTYKHDAGIYTGNSNAGLKISVVGSGSDVTAVINGNVEANSTINYSEYDDSVTGDVAGVIIGDNSIGRSIYPMTSYDEDGNVTYKSFKDGSSIDYYPDGTIEAEYNAQTGIRTYYYENGTKRLEEDADFNTIHYDENGVETHRTGDLKEKTPEVSGTANVKIEGDLTSNGTALEVVPALSGGSVNVVVEGTIKGESGAILVNDNVNAGNFNLTVWKIDPTVHHEYDENGEISGEEKSYMEVMAPDGEFFTNDTAAAEELLKQVQYIIKVDPNLSNAHVDLDGTTKFTDFTGEEYDVAHEDDKVVIKISADSGYQITGAFNGEGKEETLLRDSDGNYYIVVPRGGGVYLTATVEAISQGAPEEETKAPTRVKADESNNNSGLAALETIESNHRVAVSAANDLLRSEERKALAELSPTQQLLVILSKAGFSDVVSVSGYTLSDEAKTLLDSLEVDLSKAVRTIYRYENGVKVKWHYVELNLPGNRIARFGFRQLEDGSWIVKML